MKKTDEGKKLISEGSISLKKMGPAKKFDNITVKIIASESNLVISETRTKRDEVWSILANQVVGAENLKN